VKKSFEIEPYLMLGVSQNASEDEIIKAYRRLALLNHPRRHGPGIEEENKDLAIQIRTWKFIALAACFETLSFPQYRHQYDATMDALMQDRRRKEQNRARRKKGFPKTKGIWENVKRGLDIVDSEDFPNAAHSRECTEERDASLYKPLHHESSPFEADQREEKNETILHIRKDYKSLVQNNSPMSDESKESRFSFDYDSPNSEEENEEVRQETDMLFGGPLAPLYKARNHEPFTEAAILFEKEFGSQIFRSCIDEEDASDDDGDIPSLEEASKGISRDEMFEALGPILTPPKRRRKSDSKHNMVYPTLPDLPLDVLKQSGVSFVQNDTNTQLKKTNLGTTSISILEETSYDEIIRTETKTRILGSTRLVRTERTKTNVKSGKKVTSIQVSREELAPEEVENMREDNNEPLLYGRSQSGIVCCLGNGASDECREKMTHRSGCNEDVSAVNPSFENGSIQARFHEVLDTKDNRVDKNSLQKPFCCRLFGLC
jgi:curved DNA-binding protein CbpA